MSEETKQPIDFQVMSKGLSYLQQRADWVLVEGAGDGLRHYQQTNSLQIG